MSWFNALKNPQTIAIKKYLFEILKNDYHKYDDLIERLCPNLVTENDFNNFNKLLLELYKTGYLAAVEQHKEALEKLGLKAKITIPEQDQKENKIFNE